MKSIFAAGIYIFAITSCADTKHHSESVNIGADGLVHCCPYGELVVVCYAEGNSCDLHCKCPGKPEPK